MASDRQLATEIEYDLKKWEEEQKKAEEETRREVGDCMDLIIGCSYMCISLKPCMLPRTFVIFFVSLFV